MSRGHDLTSVRDLPGLSPEPDPHRRRRLDATPVQVSDPETILRVLQEARELDLRGRRRSGLPFTGSPLPLPADTVHGGGASRDTA
jgi:hypothetical protein